MYKVGAVSNVNGWLPAWQLQYDKNKSGALEFEELHAVLADLGIMVNLPSLLVCWYRMWRCTFGQESKAWMSCPAALTATKVAMRCVLAGRLHRFVLRFKHLTYGW